MEVGEKLEELEARDTCATTTPGADNGNTISSEGQTDAVETIGGSAMRWPEDRRRNVLEILCCTAMRRFKGSSLSAIRCSINSVTLGGLRHQFSLSFLTRHIQRSATVYSPQIRPERLLPPQSAAQRTSKLLSLIEDEDFFRCREPILLHLGTHGEDGHRLPKRLGSLVRSAVPERRTEKPGARPQDSPSQPTLESF